MRQEPPLVVLELVPAQEKEFTKSCRTSFDDLLVTSRHLVETIPNHRKTMTCGIPGWMTPFEHLVD